MHSNDQDPSTLTASAASQALQSGTLDPMALLTACIARIEAVNPALNAICTTAFAQAETAARAAQSRLRAGTPLSAIDGLPVAIKDNQLTAGIRTTRGSPLYANDVPHQDAGIVRRIKAAGGVIIGKTNIPELSIGANTVNPVFGATGNPFNPELTCGGSSGGSAVAVAANMVPLATGSDHGGSLRIPASYCGVVGYRATPGVVANEERTISQTNYSVQGPVARTVADAALLLSIIAMRDGETHLDPMAFPQDAGRFRDLDTIDPAELRVAVSEDLGGVLVSEGNRNLFREKVARFSHAFAACDNHPVDISAAPGVDWLLRQDVFATQYVTTADDWPPEMNPNVRATYDTAIQASVADIARGRREQMRLYREMGHLFRDYDLLIVPGMSIPPFPWRDLNPQQIDGKPVANYMAWLALTSSLTVVGHPVISLPCGLDRQGTPFGIQLVGAPYSDHRLLGMALAIETLLAGDPLLARPQPAL